MILQQIFCLFKLWYVKMPLNLRFRELFLWDVFLRLRFVLYNRWGIIIFIEIVFHLIIFFFCLLLLLNDGIFRYNMSLFVLIGLTALYLWVFRIWFFKRYKDLSLMLLVILSNRRRHHRIFVLRHCKGPVQIVHLFFYRFSWDAVIVGQPLALQGQDRQWGGT